MKQLALMLFLFICHPFISAGTSYVYDYTDNCSRAYQGYMSLHIPEAKGALFNEIKANPYNLMATYISDYEDCIVLLLNCDKAEYKLRESHLDERLDLLEKGDHRSPWYRFCQAGVYLHWAIINMRFGDYYHQAIYFRRSFMLLKENKRLFPDFEYNNVFSGLQEAVAGSLPDNYKWLASLFGIKGSVKKGTAQLGAFVSTHTAQQPLYSETILYYLFTRFYLLAEQKEVWDFINSTQFPTTHNLLNTFAKVSLALDYRKADAAIATLRSASTEPGYGSYPVFDYMMGVALYTKGDTACNGYFMQYLKKNKSDVFIKDAWQKMAFNRYIAGDMKEAEYCRKQAGLEGAARLDADKQAEKFAESKVWPFKKLLQARLLIEGGYYNEAHTVLNGIDSTSLSNLADRAEYYFRSGRVYEESGDGNKALEYYQCAINTGKKRHEQFAARAALQKGRIYELAGKNRAAITSYKECLDMPGHDFQNSIDHQAKAGLNRVEGN